MRSYPSCTGPSPTATRWSGTHWTGTSVDVLNDDVGMYAFLRGPGLDADRLERAGLRTKPATAFGLAHGVRVNIARPIDVVEQALHIIQQTAHA